MTGSFPDVGRDGRVLIAQANGEIRAFNPRDGKTEKLGTLPAYPQWGLVLWSPDEHSVAYMRNPTIADDPNAGLWVYDFKNPPRQIFRGWVSWFARGEGNEIDVLERRPDLTGAFWKVNWNGQALTRIPATIQILYDSNYLRENPHTEFSVSPDGRYLAFQTEQVLEENIGMIENVH